MNLNREQLKADLMRDEGVRYYLYEDTKGKATIGIGRNLEKGLSRAAINFLYEEDEDSAIAGVMSLGLPLDEVRTRALVNMCFNLGLRKLCGFKKMLDHLHDKEWKDAAREALDSLWADETDGRQDGKLGVRARRLAYMIEFGEDAPF